MDTYEKGEQVILRVRFQNSAGADVDPTDLTLRVKDPLGVVTVYVFGTDPEIVKSATGNYHCAVDPEIQGAWVDKWRGTGSNKGAAKHMFQVLEDFFD